MSERTGTLVKFCKGHVNDSSTHANPIFLLSEEHQALADTKMTPLNLQQPVLLHNSPFTPVWAPEKSWQPTPTSLSTNSIVLQSHGNHQGGMGLGLLHYVTV